ncbi:NAD+ synthase (glutamine-hydrolysing) [Larkinella arboricola]|uniref:Glutamine-dependent NAD(+) synthetase n=1 Tax=Larkinella arboricola TaxID=643671 RepID=A0A327WVX2_LARAB|nr:NAD(+) synthase [Larkinella arboricola]RAJ95836.1 NAD+ synthase (glutamine-hydrolysing) [Larkinella arboricola]
MKLIKVAAGVVNQIPMAWEHNRRTIIDAIEDAKRQEVSILCLPELCITGYGCEDMFFSNELIEQAKQSLLEIVPHTGGIIVAVSLPLRLANNRTYDTACLIADKRILGFVCKQVVANNGIHYESRWFQPWTAGVRDEIQIGEFTYPVGDLLFDVSGVKIGFEICEDAWIANRPGRSLHERGVDIILNPSASHFSFFKSVVRERFVIDGSRAFGVSYIYCNLLGNESGRAIFDGDAMIAANGQLLVSGPRFSYADHMLVCAVIDVDDTRLSQVQNKVNLAYLYPNLRVAAQFDFPKIKPVVQKPELEYWERGNHLKEEEFARAVALALFDYLRKSRSHGFVLSLSGGADSSAIAALVSLMIRLTDESIGLDGLKKKLSYIKAIQNLNTVEEICGALLTTIYQGTENSSKDTLHSAESLAKSIGATFYNININGLVETYTKLIEDQIGRKLSWNTDDIALQNIQARVRAPSAWLLANIHNALLLSTSNRSEASVGYATMDGDTAGSISPIAGIDKHYLRGWLRWAETEGVGGTIKVEGLKAVNNLQPTAELRPLDKKQTDEEDLMPYEVLNAIEKAAIRDKQSPKEVMQHMEVIFDGQYSREQLYVSVDRFFRLWSRNQWKRERYAPSFHLDDENVDPKTWCRFPILSSGFEKELAELKEYVDGKDGPGRKGKIGF